MTEPTKEPWESRVKTQVYEVNNGWYRETVIPHPDNPEMPDQMMTIKCDNQWWARFLETSIKELLQSPFTGNFLEQAPEFRYEG